MSAPIKPDAFPRYFKDNNALFAFIQKDQMYKIQPIGSNTNPGVTIDYYTTRKMVIKHWPPYYWRKEVSKEKFKELLFKLFNAYIDKITN